MQVAARSITPLEPSRSVMKEKGGGAARDLELVPRTLPDEVRDGAMKLLAGDFADARVLVAVRDLEAAFQAPADRPGLAALGADLAQLGRAFAARVEEPVVEVRVERVVDDACRAFHRDWVRLRLMTTYAGPGTEYVADADAEAALRLQKRFEGLVHRCPTGALAWAWGAQAGCGRGLVHRSPPIRGAGLARLFATFNTPSAASPPLWAPAEGLALSCRH